MDYTGLKSLLNTPSNIVITTHHKPDGDAIGSSLGLFHFLVALGHQVQVITPNDYPQNLHWLPGNKLIINAEDAPEKAAHFFNKADIIFCLDFNDLSRVNQLGPLIAQSDAAKVLIDHHLEPKGFAQYVFSDTHASSTCELVYRIITTAWGNSYLNTNIGYPLFTGLITDTGSFRYQAANSVVFKMAAHLIDLGVQHHQINNKLFNQNSLNKTQFLGYCLHKKLVCLPQYKTGLMAISEQELNMFDVKTGDTEGLVNYILAIEGIEMAVLIIDRTKMVKLSFRSTGTIPVNQLAKNYFEGGGHLNAAGGSSHRSLEKTVEHLISILPAFYQDQIAVYENQ